MNEPYKPIACHFYDELEALAVKKVKVTLTYINEQQTITLDNVLLIDFQTKNKEEFVILSQGSKIRLDHIQSIKPCS